MFLNKFLKGFVYAYHGIVHSFTGRNMRVHGLVAIVVITSGLFLGLSTYEWIIILILIALVLSAEITNTAIEDLANTLRDTNKLSYEATKHARDLAAGAVLVLAFVSAIIGSIIFLPKVFNP